MLRGLSCLLVCENAPARLVATVLTWFVRKLSACMRNITAFCQDLLRPMRSAVLVDSKPKYRPDISPWSISNMNQSGSAKGKLTPAVVLPLMA